MSSDDKEPSPVAGEQGHNADGSTTAPHNAHQPHHARYGPMLTGDFIPDGEDDDDPTLQPEVRRKMVRDRTRELRYAEARRLHAQRRYLVRKPRPLQYFRRKRLIRDPEERTSGRLELFFDLSFVGIIAVLAEEVIAHPTGVSVVRYLITYCMGFLVWQWMREIFNNFYKDDLPQRALVLFTMCCLIVFGNNATGELQESHEESPARAASVGAFLCAELGIFSTFFLYSFHIKPYRAQLRAHCLCWLISSALWIGTIFVEVRPAIALAAVALFWEFFCWPACYTQTFKDVFKLRYSSALNIDHEIERLSDFFTLVCGEFLFSVFSGSPAGTGVHETAGRAVMSVMLAFCFQLFYMQSAGSKCIIHPIRGSSFTGISWFYTFVPTVCALTLTGDATAELISHEEVEDAIRWLFCETYAIALIGLTVMACLETERDAPGDLWLPKWARLTPRVCSALVAIFLPLSSHEKIQSMQLLGITTAMSMFSMIWEMVTCLDGPNAPAETAPEHLLDGDEFTPAKALRTPEWTGCPTIAEPGSWHFDRSHQREHANDASTIDADTVA